MAHVPSPSESRYAARTLKLGVALLGYAALASAWELLASQVPGSPLYIGVLPGPIGALREMALTLALLGLAAGALWSRAFGSDSDGTRARTASSLLLVGALLALAAQSYGAAHGMHGHQMSDLRSDARAVFYLRHGGLLVFGLGWLEIGWRLFRRAPPT